MTQSCTRICSAKINNRKIEQKMRPSSTAFDILLTELSKSAPLDSLQISWLQNNSKPLTSGKRTILLKPEERQERIWLNCRGLLKYYYIDYDGNERIKHFCSENNFVLSVSAFYKQETSRFFIETLEDTELVELPASEFLKESSPGGIWYDVFHKYLLESLLEKEKREEDFLLLNAAERYSKFVSENPTLASRLRQYEISSYLGIDPAHLSRIRAKQELHASAD